MPSFKTRRQHIAQGGTQIGANGNAVNTLFYGSACINCPSALGDGRVSASMAVSNVLAGDQVFLTSTCNMPAGMFIYNAISVAGGIAASFMNSGSTDNSSSANVTVDYLVVT